ncbi:dipeptide/oligopeptide/nickel ABC transporter permease/ATP-binding protein [Arthrobacter sp. NPDC058130]|uniref:dipeptide/oligopeptide/nickel ABC transporter permease/ATP-binding protein n=1 Tax=Arthrobacter sp. NPDC058130 TaxID=3346353 RepID=UPI0036EF89DD
MSESTTISFNDATTAAAEGRSGLVRRFLHRPLGVAALAILALLVFCAVFAPFITWNEPGMASLNRINAVPGGGYLLGGDSAGRDVFARLIYGTRLTLVGALIAAAVAAVVGVGFGLVAGYRGKSFDLIGGGISDLVMVLPSMIVLVALYTVTGPNAYIAMSVLGIMLAPSFFRLTRNMVIQVRKNLYVDAAKVAGLSDSRIISRHILSAVRAPIVIHFVLIMSVAIIVQSGLDFIGLGDPAVPTWGGMLQDAFRAIYQAPTSFIWPGLAIGITVASLMLLGNALRDAMEDLAPQAKRRRAPRGKSTGRVQDKAQSATPEAKPEISPDVLMRVDGLVVGYDRKDGTLTKVVDGVSFDVRAGEMLGVVGESGSGKTQTALAVLRLLPYGGKIAAGRVWLAGNEITTADEKEMTKLRGVEIAYIPQEPMSNLDPSARIGSQLAEPIRIKLGISRDEAKKRALDLLKQVNISDPQRVYDSYPHEISGGMAQRVLIAGAVSCDPQLIIADEPTTALDVTVQAEILEILRRLQKSRGLAVMLVTHNFGVVADVCDRVVVMKSGKIIEQNDVTSIFSNPRHEYTQMLLNSTLHGRPARVQRDNTEVIH